MDAIEPLHPFADSAREDSNPLGLTGTEESFNLARRVSASGDLYWLQQQTASRPESPSNPPQAGKHSLVVVDSRVEDLETLLAGLAPNTEVALLNPHRDGIAGVSELLAGREDISSLHLISHGSAGSLQLGSTTLDTAALAAYRTQIQSWGRALTAEADILLYGCNVAADPQGGDFVKQFAALTGADVAASNNLTGNRASGGDWILEVFTGSIEADLALQGWAQAAYGAVFGTVTDLPATAASYFGTAGDDAGHAVEIAPDNTILIGGTVGGKGTVLRLDATGQTLLGQYAVGTNIKDLDVNRNNGNISVVGDGGVTTLKSDGGVLWSQSLSGATNTRRVAVAQDGTVAALESNNSGSHRVTVWNAAGTQQGSFAIADGKSVEDIAIDSNTGSVFVAGFRQVASDLQLPLFRSYSYAGGLKWSNYDFSAAQAKSKGDTADSRGLRVALGRDGMLYYAGSLDGGTTIYRRDARNINQNANNINIDNYTNTSNTGVGKYGYFARVNPATGAVLQGQYVVNRLSSGKGNSFGIQAITADESGQVFIGGSSMASAPNRSSLQVNGSAIGGYTANEGAVIAISADFKSRELVAVWTGTGTKAPSGVNGVAAAKGIRAIASAASGSMMTVNPLQASSAGGNDLYFSVWGLAAALPSISIADLQLQEGNDGSRSAELTVTLSQQPTKNVTLDFATLAGTATEGSDYIGKTGTLTFTPGGPLVQKIQIAISGDANFEANETFSVKLSNISTNATLAKDTGTVTVLNDDSNAPTAISISRDTLAENSTQNTPIGTFSTADADAGDTHTYTLLDDGGGRFKIEGDRLLVADGSKLDFESNRTHAIAVRSTDAAGLFFDRTFTINLQDVNEVPTTTGLAPVKIANPQITPGTTIEVAKAFRDVDGGDRLTYSIAGNTNPHLFRTPPTLDAKTGKLTLNYLPTALGKTSLTLRATDAKGLFVETAIAIDVGTPLPNPTVPPPSPTQPGSVAPANPATNAPTQPGSVAPANPATNAPTQPGSVAPANSKEPAPTKIPTQFKDSLSPTAEATPQVNPRNATADPATVAPEASSPTTRPGSEGAAAPASSPVDAGISPTPSLSLSPSVPNFNPVSPGNAPGFSPIPPSEAQNFRKQQLYDHLGQVSRVNSPAVLELFDRVISGDRSPLASPLRSFPDPRSGPLDLPVLPSPPTSNRFFQTSFGDLLSQIGSQFLQRNPNSMDLEFWAAAGVLISVFVGNYNFNSRVFFTRRLKPQFWRETSPLQSTQENALPETDDLQNDFLIEELLKPRRSNDPFGVNKAALMNDIL